MECTLRCPLCRFFQDKEDKDSRLLKPQIEIASLFDARGLDGGRHPGILLEGLVGCYGPAQLHKEGVFYPDIAVFRLDLMYSN